jgi:alpha-ketoglutarate-dependent 2,4-dichlorophenoxyacetate dioxygenase
MAVSGRQSVTTQAGLSARRLHPLFAAEMAGVDLRLPVDATTITAVIRALDDHAVCVYPHDAPLTNEQHIAFSSRLGPVERKLILKLTGTVPRLPFPEIIDQSNLDQNGEIFHEDDRRLIYKRANRLWHTDVSFHPVRATYSLLSAHVVPPSGADTEFADMRAAYDALPVVMKARLEGLVAEHSYWYSRVLAGGPEPSEAERQTRPPAQHPLVHRHPGSGRSTLYLASHASHIIGWPIAEGRALIRELTEFATEPRFVFRHHWRVGDVVIWDNLATMHRATPFDDTTQRRDMRRTTCREGTLQLEATL